MPTKVENCIFANENYDTFFGSNFKKTYRKNRNIIKKLPEREMPLKIVMNKLMNNPQDSERIGNTSNSLGTRSR